MSSIQPLFGVLIAMVFLSEIPSLKSVLGGVLILTTVVLENWRVKEKNKKGKTYL
jgi:drug/metabolite transporter (DMT)-like permease